MSADALTLSIERRISAPRSVVWRCWTEPGLLRQWYCPKPWRVTEAEIDLKPGGRMNVAMGGPDGEAIAVKGCLLAVETERRLVFTDAFTEGYMPQPDSFMTGVVEFEDAEGGSATAMRWSARHATEDAVKRHLDMGFEAGWNAAADQLDELAASLA